MQLNDATVLIVEDEPTICEIMGAWFGRHAGRVFTAANGAEALKVLAANPVDLVITDIRMPVMDGVTLLKRIKASGPPQPRVVFVTGFSDLEPREAYDLGAEAMLEKPVDRDELLQVARRGLMGRGELWHTPVAAGPESVVLQLNLTGFAEALQEHRIALGRGGLCVESRPALHEESVGLLVEFRNDKGQMQGQGIVRWVAPAEELAGIELLYLDAPNSALVADIAERTEFAAFIPASLSKEHAAAKSA